MNSDQVHRSTMGIYSNLMEDFNPSLQNLVSLGSSYARAFKALAVTSEAYFSALSKIGEKAFHTASSHPLGDVLIQVSENQRRLTLELDGVFRWFSIEVLQKMDNNILLDQDYISDSRNQYEREVYNQSAAAQGRLSRGTNQDYSEFLRESHREALKEEERRYRFLAEKHCQLTRSIAQLMNKMGSSLEQRADAWIEDVNGTRRPEARQGLSVDNALNHSNQMGIRREDIRWSREEQPLGKIPSRAPSPQGSISGAAAADSLMGSMQGRSTRALTDHHPFGSNPTLLPFSRGEIITVLVPQPRNGWLYGRDKSSGQGWFPAAYVELVEDPPKTIGSSNSSPWGRNSSSNSSSTITPTSSRSTGGPAPPLPPPLPSSSSSSSSSLSSLRSSNNHSGMQPNAPTPQRRVESSSEIKKSKPQGSQPELFPRGTNPFATVKLKATYTDDRSAPRV